MKVYVMLADGFEDIEALAVVDVLRRGGVDTVTVSVKNDKVVLSAHNIPVVSDVTLSQISVEKDDMIVLPGGGKGVENLKACEPLKQLLIKHQEHEGLLAAICAGPTVPGKLGLLKGVKATCYPGCEGDLDGAVFSEDSVVIDKNFVTSRGPGLSLDFALELLKVIKGGQAAEKVRSAMLYKG